MDSQKKFQKKSLNSDDYKGTEQGAKAAKGIFSSLGALALIVVNKDNLKVFGSGAIAMAKKAIKR